MSVDSSAYVFDMTKYITSPDKRLQRVDPMGAESFGGLLTANLSHKPSSPCRTVWKLVTFGQR